VVSLLKWDLRLFFTDSLSGRHHDEREGGYGGNGMRVASAIEVRVMPNSLR